MKRLLLDACTIQDRKIAGLTFGLLMMIAYTVNPDETKLMLRDSGIKYKEEEASIIEKPK